MVASGFKQLWKNEYFQTAITIILILVVVFGFWFGSQLVLHSQYPALAVASGSMCILPGAYCDGWTHPFEHTLHVGDLIIVQGMAPEEIKTGPYPTGDIIVFHQSLGGDELIVHRAIDKQISDGTTYFITKGDGNSGSDPAPIPSDRVVGKVVLRIPWIGHLALMMRNSSGILIILALIVVLIVIEFLIPVLTKSRRKTNSSETPAKPETYPTSPTD